MNIMKKNSTFFTILVMVICAGCSVNNQTTLHSEVTMPVDQAVLNQLELNDQETALTVDFLRGRWAGFVFQTRPPLDRDYYSMEVQIEDGYVIYRYKNRSSGEERRFIAAYEIRGDAFIIFIPSFSPMTKSGKTIILTYNEKTSKLYGHRGDENNWRWILERKKSES